MAVDALKVPPQSIDAEQSVLGGLLLDNQRWDAIADKISADDFYRREHRVIFNAISALCGESNPADVITVSERLESQGELEAAGGLAYLGALANNTPSAANIVAYAAIVRERSVLRSLVNAATEISELAYSPDGRTAGELLDLAEKRIFDISEMGGRARTGYQPIASILSATVDRIDQLYRTQGSVTGVATGFTDLDEKTSGLQNSDLIIIAGRPSMGKTTLAMNIAENAAVGHRVPVAVFSLEMPGTQLAMRMMASLGRINSHRVRTGKLDDEDWPRLTSAVSLLSEAPIFIDDTPGITPMELRARARRIKREHGLGLIIVDYLQLMQSTETTENRATEISQITRALKGLAKELDVPLIAMSQLNRSLENRTDKRPVMSDLRESGAIEQDADVILFIYRDEVYNEDSPAKGTAEVIIAKQRNGPIGKVTLTFLGEYTKFENYISGGFERDYA
ncbi:DNA helicase [Sulfurifustis variabilis]|uniref:Replicative DNA helicase n=1 Tax=Sulfurifustis variabilis TaxID=1675686 RepID=A0A1B4V4M6_9GAMM|nr:replicative DNA helicase [Sulfurifustis variabilis]BAU48469.1 DNA helicase [Sulfurifustis variabilis]